MPTPDRRQVLTTAAAGLFAPALPFSLLPGRRADPAERLIRTLIDMPRERLFETIEPLMRRGLTWRDLQAAVFHAGILEVQPRPVGFKLHAVMVVESLFQIAESGNEVEAWLAVLWNLADFKNSQARDVSEGDWRLPAAPRGAARATRSPAAVSEELRAALDAGDAERADQAVVVALRELDRETLFELLWSHSLRDFTNLGHKPIFCSHVERVLSRLGDARAEPALRSLVFGLLDQAPGNNLEEHAASSFAVSALPADLGPGRRSPDASLELALGLRTARPAEARALVINALREGVHPASIWDGLRLDAGDMFARRPALLPVHPTTVTSALHYISTATRDVPTRRIALLQAASWLPLFRQALRLPAEAAGLDALLDEVEHEPTTLTEVFEAPDAQRTRAFLAGPGDASMFGAALRRTLLERGAREHHQHKYAAAILEDSRSADPRWLPALMATSLEYLPSRNSPETVFARESRELLARLAGR